MKQKYNPYKTDVLEKRIVELEKRVETLGISLGQRIGKLEKYVLPDNRFTYGNPENIKKLEDRLEKLEDPTWIK